MGDIATTEAAGDQDMVQRDDGSWLVDGDVGLEHLKSVLDIDGDLPGESSHNFHTLGGLLMHVLGRIPATADRIEVEGWRFEVMDMDRNRVDKVLAIQLPHAQEAAPVEG